MTEKVWSGSFSFLVLEKENLREKSSKNWFGSLTTINNRSGKHDNDFSLNFEAREIYNYLWQNNLDKLARIIFQVNRLLIVINYFFCCIWKEGKGQLTKAIQKCKQGLPMHVSISLYLKLVCRLSRQSAVPKREAVYRG